MRIFLKNLFSFFKAPSRWPSRRQWLMLPTLLTARERTIMVGLLLLIIVSSFALAQDYYHERTTLAPAKGGLYGEGAVGQPRFINPVLSPANDVDRDLSALIFSGLLKYTPAGALEPDLADAYRVEENKIYTFSLKQGITWQDGNPLTANDVIFTLGLIQNPDYKSPLRPNWQGVKVEKIDASTVRFTLSAPYAPFLENATIGILPKHLWQTISAPAFALAAYNLEPVGTGPYRLTRAQKDNFGSISSLTLELWPDYYGTKPFLSQIQFQFFKNEDALLEAFRKRQISGLSFVSAKNQNSVKEGGAAVYALTLPRYYAVFFNQTSSKPLADKSVRLALQHATDKQEIVNAVLSGSGIAVDSPIPPGLLGFSEEIKKYDFSVEKAKTILENAGWKDGDGDGVLEKKFSATGGSASGGETDEKPTPLEITLTTTQWPELIQTAELLKNQWQKIGMRVSVEVLDINEIQQNRISNRNYQAILFGEVLGQEPDPFSFWHSSQKKYPGLNLALYDNKETDKLLEEARQLLDTKERARKYEAFQKLVVEDVPAVFLYNPSYLYAVSESVKGIEVKNIATPSQRFSGIEHWYINTKRVWKK